jgi:hypothetical protein
MKDAILITDAEPSEGIGHKIIYVNEAFYKNGNKRHQLSCHGMMN